MPYENYYSDPSTAITPTGGIGEFLSYLNEVTFNWLAYMIVIAIFVIFVVGYLRSRPDDYKGAFAVSSFVTFAVSIFFFLIGFVDGKLLGIVIGVLIISVLFLYLDNRQ